jgi:pSer/pThr/pTyr-binding forkhead associated (FHA) protein
MEVTLKVLDGAKSGAKISVKKAEFIIGRSQSCHLCAGSSAISRQHCAIIRDDHRVAIKDLGSRNGTLVNGQKIAGEVELASGDEIIVGPLKFLITITPGINNLKKPEVKSVAESVARTADSPSSSVGDEDISRWLLNPASALTETQTIRIDDTNAIQRMHDSAASGQSEMVGAENADAENADSSEVPTTADEAAEESSVKRAPGKLPKLPAKPGAKDSREAAVEALRAWSRRR